jgi:hypothetical protein
LSFLRWCDQVTQPKAPLNNAAIYPITRSISEEPPWDRYKENLVRPYVFLAHPAWSWWQCFKLHSSRNALLIIVASWSFIIWPPYTTMG